MGLKSHTIRQLSQLERGTHNPVNNGSISQLAAIIDN